MVAKPKRMKLQSNRTCVVDIRVVLLLFLFWGIWRIQGKKKPRNPNSERNLMNGDSLTNWMWIRIRIHPASHTKVENTFGLGKYFLLSIKFLCCLSFITINSQTTCIVCYFLLWEEKGFLWLLVGRLGLSVK